MLIFPIIPLVLLFVLLVVASAVQAVKPSDPDQYIQLAAGSCIPHPSSSVELCALIPGQVTYKPIRGKREVVESRNIGAYESVAYYATTTTPAPINCQVSWNRIEDVQANPGQGTGNAQRQRALEAVLAKGTISCDHVGELDLTGAVIGVMQ